MTLDRSANQNPVPDNIRTNIIKGLWQWNTTLIPQTAEETWDTYFHYYASKCKTWIEYGHGEYTFVRKDKDITAIAKKLEDGTSKAEIKRWLLLKNTQERLEDVKERMAEGSVRLVVRLTTMVDIGYLPGTNAHISLPWDSEQTDLKTLLATYFKGSSTDSEKIKFETEMTAFNITRYTGLKIRWTDNLADHLRLIENDKELCIFHHITFLKRQIDSPIFPAYLAKETLQTLALLFPRYDRDTEKWLKPKLSTSGDAARLDKELLSCDRVMPEDRRAEKFKFWREELITLKEKFDTPRPTSIVQFWYDRRNKVQWYTFWIAVLVLVLTVFFGLVQSLEGALQVYKAYHPMAS
ncbi:hypothetical protein DM02DRAFT_569914 [Periconia macrospinosa]|uniref:Uncharacterized protein n=1 Tax=Periconia macrospinosa TaxID=97972 RepID=A0A2V1DGM3_9PLEO|nr:hypothetical protein DM02DRAFT_569914 [Periconia macrospinosa]